MLVLLPVVALVFAGCWRGESDSAAEPESNPETTQPAMFGGSEVTPAWRFDTSPIAQPVVVDDVAVMIVLERAHELDIVGVDTASGEELWRHPYSPGYVPTGYGIGPSIIRGKDDTKFAVFQKPGTGLSKDDAWRYPLVTVDVTTGKIVSQSRALLVTTPVENCDDGHDACMNVYDDASEIPRHVRFTVADGSIQQLKNEAGAIPENTRSIGEEGLYSTNDRPGEKIGRMVDGKRLWERPVQEMYGENYSSDGGWQFLYHEGIDAFIGSVGHFEPDDVDRFEAGETLVTDLGTSTEAAIDAATGDVLWKETGVRLFCTGSGRLGARESDEDDEGTDEVAEETDEPSLWTWCREEGTRTDNINYDEPKLDIKNFTVEGVDPHTGEVAWSVEPSAKAAKRLARGILERAPLTEGGTVVETVDGWRMVTVQEGEQHPVPEGQVFLCGQDREFDYAAEWSGYTERFGGTLAYTCTVDGTATEAPLTDAVLRDIAVEVNEHRYVYAADDGLVAYELQ